ncbi:MAG: hypothetical protein H6Q51_2875, partial [Deltaproteobacteria bacterium]|nr:hypothetical protein [Deltaproteobacteria bacterium]
YIGLEADEKALPRNAVFRVADGSANLSTIW